MGLFGALIRGSDGSHTFRSKRILTLALPKTLLSADTMHIWRGTYGLRRLQLTRQVLCERCLSKGKTTPATTVNHRKPHKDDWSLFIDPLNHESTCKDHHDSTIKAEENQGYTIGTDINIGDDQSSQNDCADSGSTFKARVWVCH
jgi:hypothetical protein